MIEAARFVVRRFALVLVALLLLAWSLAEEVTFRYHPPAGAEPARVSLRGGFNDWGETPMERREDGSWTVTIDLEPGEYQYKFFIDGVWPQDMADWNGAPVDPTADGYVDDGQGGRNAVRYVLEAAAPAPGTPPLDESDLAHRPDDPAYLAVVGDRLVVRLQAGRDQVRSARVTTEAGDVAMVRQLWWGNREVWRASLPFGETRYRLAVEGFDGTSVELDDGGAPFAVAGEADFPTVDWVGDQVFYQILPDRFFNGNPYNDRFALASDETRFNTAGTSFGGPPLVSAWDAPPGPGHCCRQYFGGDLAGVIAKLDYLRDLGVTALYLNPIFDSGSAHGYDTHDYLQVSPRFGSNDTLRDLLDLAHARGIRVLLDFVPNHTGIGFWAFQDVVERGPESAYWDWYLVERWPFEAGATDAYAFWSIAPSLPKLNVLDPEVAAYLLEVARFWIEFGIDGWRVDAPAEVLGARDFFAEFRRVVKEANPDAYLVGEVWRLEPEWLQGDAFDSLMNYAIGREVVLRYAAGGNNPFASAARTQAQLSRAYGSYGENVAAMGFNLLDSHDTPRALTDLGGGAWGERPDPGAVERLKLASTLLYALPGAPVTFQGDECGFLGQTGAEGTQDLHRYPLQWQACDERLRQHYRDLAALRRELPALRSAVYRTFDAGDALGFFRGEPGATGEVLVLANNTERELAAALPVGAWRATDRGGLLRDRREVVVPPVAVRIFVRTAQP